LTLRCTCSGQLRLIRVTGLPSIDCI
jgi:hypothetical protein